MHQIERAIHDTVMRSPEMTCEEIAARLGRGAQVLRNKANPDQEGHIMGYMEMVAIMAMTGDYSAHRATGDYLESLKPIKPHSKTLIETIFDLCKGHGDVVSGLHESLSDGRFSDRERAECLRRVDDFEAMLPLIRQAILNHKDGLRSI